MAKRSQRRCHVHDCQEKIADDAYVCEPCLAELDHLLAGFPALWEQLEVTLTKQAKLATGQKRTSKGAAKPLPFHVAASDVAARINNTLSTWARVIMADYACPAAQPAAVDLALIEWMRDQLPWLATQRFGGEAVGQISDEISVIWQVIDRPTPQRYLGLCDCGEQLYAAHGRTYAPCGNCSLIHDVEALQNRLLLQAEDRLEAASVLSSALTVLGEAVTQVQISRWVARGRLLARGHGKDGRALYRLGDVRALAAELDRKRKGA